MTRLQIIEKNTRVRLKIVGTRVDATEIVRAVLSILSPIHSVKWLTLTSDFVLLLSTVRYWHDQRGPSWGHRLELWSRTSALAPLTLRCRYVLAICIITVFHNIAILCRALFQNSDLNRRARAKYQVEAHDSADIRTGTTRLTKPHTAWPSLSYGKTLQIHTCE